MRPGSRARSADAQRRPKALRKAPARAAWGGDRQPPLSPSWQQLGGGWFTWSLHRVTAAHYVTQKLDRGSIVHTVTASGVVNPTAAAPLGAHGRA